MKGRIGFDIDGIIVDFAAGLHKFLKDKGHDLLPLEILSNTFYWEHCMPESAAEILKVFSPGNNDFWEGLPPVNSGKDFDVLSKFVKQNKDDIYFITSRPNFLLQPTKKWLGQNLNLSNIHIVMGAVSKASICRGLGLRAYIDDRYLFAYEIAKKSKTKSFLLTNSSNMAFGDTYKDSIYRVGGITEYISEVDK